MSRRSNPMTFFANPYVVLADVMVSLTFILALFLLSTTVYSEQMQRIAERNRRREALAQSFDAEMRKSGVLPPNAHRNQLSEGKYWFVSDNKTLLEVRDDGTLQRFRFPAGALDFKPNTAQFASPLAATRALDAIGRVLTANRSQIKSLVVEGYALPDEKNPWPLSQARAERVREFWSQVGVASDIKADYDLPVRQWMTRKKLWDSSRFSEWHLQEYEARRARDTHHPDGVLPLAWIITSGRGDSIERSVAWIHHQPVVEFKLEYAERNAPPLDTILNIQRPELRREALRDNLIQLPPTPTPTLKPATQATTMARP